MRDSGYINQFVTVSIGIAAGFAFLIGLYLGVKKISDRSTQSTISIGQIMPFIDNQ
ncbi:hypothetical protein NOS3756_40960 [Nostoc sp. NIES-3756]|uniref:hypothetical protein n=1 Tax=Nostoc sp. NIES-3756 TaxID=1751286 RepID=UPI0007200083|nr:hypothetical protein [Nostoc sp. NIES-3756]BAT55118.1 hypothetical protein NOS3756_40960 [Nostoc sp. NIES-3756]